MCGEGDATSEDSSQMDMGIITPQASKTTSIDSGNQTNDSHHYKRIQNSDLSLLMSDCRVGFFPLVVFSIPRGIYPPSPSLPVDQSYSDIGATREGPGTCLQPDRLLRSRIAVGHGGVVIGVVVAGMVVSAAGAAVTSRDYVLPHLRVLGVELASIVVVDMSVA